MTHRAPHRGALQYGVQAIEQGAAIRAEVWDEAGLKGHCTVRRDEAGWYLDNVLVYETEPSIRRRGVGSKLLGMCEEMCGERIERSTERTSLGELFWQGRR